MNHLLPDVVSLWAAPRLTALEASYAGDGIRVEIEAGPVGLVVYGPTSTIVETVARNAAASARVRDPRADVEWVDRDPSEPAASCWYAVVAFDWARQGARVAS